MSLRGDDDRGGLALAEVGTGPDAWAGLDLSDLRLYRKRLAEEEEKVSYWRRLVHARIDVLEAEAHHERPLRLDELIRVLGDTGAGRTRTALVSVRAADDLPELPVLADMWVTELDPDDTEAVAAADRPAAVGRGAAHRLPARAARAARRGDRRADRPLPQDPASALVAFQSPHTGAGRAGSMA